MRRVITAGNVEAAAKSGQQILVDATTIVTPLARDRAQVLGVRFEARAGDDQGREDGDIDLPRLVLESKVRMVARRLLLRAGENPAQLEEVVAAVMRRLDGDCGCR